MKKGILKKLTAIMLGAAMAFSASAVMATDIMAAKVSVDTSDFDSVTVKDSAANKFVKKMKAGWNLGNTLEAKDCTWLSNELDYETAWTEHGVKTTQTLIDTVKAAGFNTIRIPVSWHNHMDSNYNISDAWMDRVTDVVDMAYDKGMYVIINIHHDDEQMQPTNAAFSKSKKYVKKVWKQIAKNFKKYGERLIFETMNEPRNLSMSNEWWFDINSDAQGKESMECINKLNQVIVDTIRSTGGKNKSRYIMVPGYAASPDFTLTDYFKLPTDKKASKSNRILVSIHAYKPYNFCYNGGAFDDSAKSELKQFMRKAYDMFTSKGVGVVIGEYGIQNKTNITDRVNWAAYYNALARHYGMTACIWDNDCYNNGETFGQLDRSTNKWTYPDIIEQIKAYS